MFKLLMSIFLKRRRSYGTPIQAQFNIMGKSYIVVGNGLYLVEYGDYTTMESPSNLIYQFVMYL